MKLSSRQIDGFVSQPAAEVRVVLAYGSDNGQVREIAARLVKSIAGDASDPFRVAEITSADLKTDPARLLDEVGALALTGGRRVVRLRDAGAWAADALSDVLDDARALDSVVVAEAGELGPRDRLRKLCEDHALAASIPCYADSEQSLDQLIEMTMRGQGLTIGVEAKALLIDNLGSDRGVTRQELQKLALYVGKDSEVTADDVVACVGDGASLARDDVALAALSGDQGGLDLALSRCWLAGEAPIGILRAAARHLQRLHVLAVRKAAGANVNEAMARLRPPVFFKQQAIVRGQLQQWSPAGLAQAMNIVSEAEVDCKSTGMPDRAVCGRALIRIAHAARTSA